VRRLLIGVAVMLLAGSAAIASGSGGPTKVVRVRPVDKFSRPLPDYQVAHTFTGGDCETGSYYVAHAYRCFSGNALLDPCWAAVVVTDPQTPYAYCMGDPWSHEVFRIANARGLDSTTAGASQPWGLTLRNGMRCRFIGTGTSLFKGKRISYGCTRSLSLLASPRKTGSAWSIQAVRYDGTRYVDVGRVFIAKAWYGLPNEF
jgi:hypothetical protein